MPFHGENLNSIRLCETEKFYAGCVTGYKNNTSQTLHVWEDKCFYIFLNDVMFLCLQENTALSAFLVQPDLVGFFSVLLTIGYINFAALECHLTKLNLLFFWLFVHLHILEHFPCWIYFPGSNINFKFYISTRQMLAMLDDPVVLCETFPWMVFTLCWQIPLSHQYNECG